MMSGDEEDGCFGDDDDDAVFGAFWCCEEYLTEDLGWLG